MEHRWYGIQFAYTGCDADREYLATHILIMESNSPPKIHTLPIPVPNSEEKTPLIAELSMFNSHALHHQPHPSIRSHTSKTPNLQTSPPPLSQIRLRNSNLQMLIRIIAIMSFE